MSIGVVVADDQALVRGGFRMILDARDDIAVTGEAGDGAEAVELVERLPPDVVLMDIRMPGMDGIEATRRIAASGSAPRVVVLTTYDLDVYVFAAVRAGASGFLLKDVRPGELADAVRVVAAVKRCSRRARPGACSTASPARSPIRGPPRRSSAS